MPPLPPCTCHPDDSPPVPCAQKYALSECKAELHDKPTPERLADPGERAAFCDAIIAHGSIAAACRKLDLYAPAVWCFKRDNPEFAAQLKESRGTAWDMRIDKAHDLIDTATVGTWQLHKFKLDSELRIAGKLLPKDYGDQPNTQVNVNNMNGTTILVTEEQRKRLIDLRQELTGRNMTAEESRVTAKALWDDVEGALTTEEAELVEQATRDVHQEQLNKRIEVR